MSRSACWVRQELSYKGIVNQLHQDTLSLIEQQFNFLGRQLSQVLIILQAHVDDDGHHFILIFECSLEGGVGQIGFEFHWLLSRKQLKPLLRNQHLTTVYLLVRIKHEPEGACSSHVEDEVLGDLEHAAGYCCWICSVPTDLEFIVPDDVAEREFCHIMLHKPITLDLQSALLAEAVRAARGRNAEDQLLLRLVLKVDFQPPQAVTLSETRFVFNDSADWRSQVNWEVHHVFDLELLGHHRFVRYLLCKRLVFVLDDQGLDSIKEHVIKVGVDHSMVA